LETMTLLDCPKKPLFSDFFPRGYSVVKERWRRTTSPPLR
jgi:hypothetical protein